MRKILIGLLCFLIIVALTQTVEARKDKGIDGSGGTTNMAPYAPRDCVCNMQAPSGFYVGRGGHQYGCSCVVPGDPSYPDSIMYLQFDWGDGTTSYSNWGYANERLYASHTWPVGETPDGIQYTINVWSWTNYSATRSGRSNDFPVVMGQVTAPSALNGPISLKVDEPATYTCTAGHDPADLQVRVEYSWGDGSSDKTAWVNDLTQVSATHTWEEEGDYTIGVRTEDSDGHYSDWTTMSLSVSKSKDSNTETSFSAYSTYTTKATTYTTSYSSYWYTGSTLETTTYSTTDTTSSSTEDSTSESTESDASSTDAASTSTWTYY